METAWVRTRCSFLPTFCDDFADLCVRLVLYNTPGITSLEPMANLTGKLTGVLVVAAMHGLSTLAGLENIVDIGSDKKGQSLMISNNKNLESTLALESVRTWGKLKVNDNSMLACAPKEWPEEDDFGATIRQGVCVDGRAAGNGVVAGGGHGGEL